MFSIAVERQPMNSHVTQPDLSTAVAGASLSVDQAEAPGPQSANRRRNARRRRRRLILLVLLVAVGAGGYAAWRYYLAPTDVAEVQYITSPVVLGSIEDAVSAVGTLSASDSRAVETTVAGRIATIPVHVGDVVEAGAVVATLEAATFEAAVRVAEAQLTNLQASLADREAQLELQQQNLERQEGLLAANAAAQSAVQSARASVMSATAQLESVRSQLVQQEQALQTARDNLDATTIHAPMSGTVVALPVQEGQSVTGGAQLLTLADLSTMTVDAQISEADIGRLSAGMPAYFTTLSRSNQRWNGTLREVLPTPSVENNVVLYSVLFDVENATGELMIGMSAEAFFVVVGANNVLTIPISALQTVRSFPGGAAGRPGAAPTAAGPVVADAGVDGGAVANQPAAPAEAVAGRFGGQARAAAAPVATDPGAAAAARFGQAPAAAAAPGNPAVTAADAAAPAPADGAAGFTPGNLPEGVTPADVAAAFAGGVLPAGFDPNQFAPRLGAAGQRAAANGNGQQAAQAATGATAPTAYTVRVLLDDGTIEQRAVQIGVQDRVNAEILGGLEAGERVVTATTTRGTATGGAGAPGQAGGFAAGGFPGAGGGGGGVGFARPF